MSIILAVTLNPHEDSVRRFRELYPLMMSLYGGVSIATPPDVAPALREPLIALDGVKLREAQAKRENRRYYTIQQALTFDDVDYVHYCDGDHAISRMASDLDDWRRILTAMQDVDCLVVGRSAAVFDSYPPALRETERIINLVASYLIGQNVDLGAGTRGFSRRVVEYLTAHAAPEIHALATDAEWVVLLHRAGFDVRPFESHGATYEIYDDDHRARLESTAQWAKRVDVARIIIEGAISATRYPTAKE